MLELNIDRARFESHISAVLDEMPGLVPVAKGNGYGLGLERLAVESAAMGADTIAVGTIAEARAVLGVHAFRRVLVMTPHVPGSPLEGLAPWMAGRIVHTVASAAGAADLAGRRVVVEIRTPLNRHGLRAEDLAGLADSLHAVRCEGFTLHLPLRRPCGYHPVVEIGTLVQRLDELALPTSSLYVSHLTGTELALLGARFPRTRFQARVGTRLWLGAQGALSAQGRVLEVIPVDRGQRYGNRQHKARHGGHLVVVDGGTAHGIGLAAPRQASGPLSRMRVLAEAGLAASNLQLSPFTWAKRKRWFAEPPDLQVSLLLLPKRVRPPRIGDMMTVAPRLTTTLFDEITES